MQKAINLSPHLIEGSTEQADAFIAAAGNVDTVITWVPTPRLIQEGRQSWAASDAAVEFILSKGKRCMVAVTSGSFLPGQGYADRLKWACDAIERYPQCSIVVSNEPAFAPAVETPASEAVSPQPGGHGPERLALAAYLGRASLSAAAGASTPRISSQDSAQLMEDTAHFAASLKPGTGSTHLLGPAEATFWGTPNVLKNLWGWNPPKGIRVDVAVHHYYDIVNGGARQTRTALAAVKLLALRSHWRPNLFLTEGGFTYDVGRTSAWNADNPANPDTWEYLKRAADEATQLQRLARHIPWCRKHDRIALWANYELIDSLWSGWASGLIGHDGTPHPVLAHWAAL